MDKVKEFVPYEQALDLKELGFNEECFKFYYKKNKKLSKSYEECINFWSDSELIEQGWEQDEINEKRKYGEKFECCVGITAPLYQQAFRWFREKYNLFAESSRVEIKLHSGVFYHRFIIKGENNAFKSKDIIECKTYEEAELECLKKLIEIVKNEKTEKTKTI